MSTLSLAPAGIVWRFGSRLFSDAAEHRAQRLVAIQFLILAPYVGAGGELRAHLDQLWRQHDARRARPGDRARQFGAMGATIRATKPGRE